MSDAPLNEWEDPDPSDQDDDDEPTIPCPSCKRDIHEDAEWCPHCGEVVLEKEQRQIPLLWIAIVVLMLIATFWIIR